MPEKLFVPLRDISTVAASGTVTINCPRGQRYHKVILQHGYSSGTNTVAATATNISEIRILVNNRIQRRFSGTQLRDLNLLHGTAYDFTGVPNTSPGVAAVIFFAEPWRDDEVDQDALAWKTNLFANFQIQIDLGAASTPTLIAAAVVDNVIANGPEAIVKIERQQFGASGTSFDYTKLVSKDFLQLISIYPDSGGSNAPTPVTFRRGSEILHDNIAAALNTANLVTNRMTPAASGRTSNVYDLAFDADGLLGSAVDLRGGPETTLTIGAGSAMSGTTTAIIARLGPPD